MTPPVHITKPQTFILESLSLEDEKSGRMDGKILYEILRLHGKEPIYYYFRTQAELIQLLQIFRESGYRYLHLSCHGNDAQIDFTFNSSDFPTLSRIFDGKLNNRRLFISGCNLGNMNLAQALFATNGGMYSLTAPIREVYFDQTLSFWSAFYYLMHAHDSSAMKKRQLTDSFIQLTHMFEMPVAHYFKNTKNGGAIEESIFKGKPTSVLAKITKKGSPTFG